MSPLGYRTATEHSARRSTSSAGSRLLVGCAIGCGGLIVISAAIIAAVAWWALTPGRQHPTIRLVGEQSTLVAGFSPSEDADQLTGLLSEVLEKAQQLERRHRPLPDGLAWLEELEQLQDARMAGDIAALIPRDATVSVTPGLNGDDVVAAANFRRFVRPIRAMIMGLAGHASDPAGPVLRTVDGHEVLTVDDGLALSFVDGTFVLGSTDDIVGHAVRSLQNGDLDPPFGSSRVAETVGELHGSWPVFVVADNSEGVLGRLAEEWAAATAADRTTDDGIEADTPSPEAELLRRLAETAQFLTSTARIVPSSTIHIELDIESVDADAGARAHRLVEQLVTAATETLTKKGFSVEHRIERDQRTVQATLDISEIDRAIQLWFQSFEDPQPRTVPSASAGVE